MREENEQFEKEKFDKIWIQYETEQEEISTADIKEKEEAPAEKPVILAEHIKEETAYLDEMLKEYERFVLSIGNLKYTAAMLLYYRDEIQESLDFLKQNAELQDYWRKVVYLDNILRSKAPVFVKEVGYNNFKQYQIVNDPPKLYWWWYLNRQVSAPPSDKKWWQVWK